MFKLSFISFSKTKILYKEYMYSHWLSVSHIHKNMINTEENPTYLNSFLEYSAAYKRKTPDS